MAELLIRVHDKEGVAPENVDRVCQSGDVVAVCRDGWVWSQRELTAPYWRIVKAPGMTLAEAALLTAPPLDGTRRRERQLDLSKLNSSFITDDTRASPFFTLSAQQVRQAVKQRTARRLNVIG